MSQNKYFVSGKDESLRMFQNDFLDKISRVSWYVPLLIFAPIIALLLYHSISDFDIPLKTRLMLFVLGLLVWSVVEYVFHRFIFHYHPKSNLGKKVFFVIHGVHHDYPNDSKRLVMPPVMSIPLATGFYFLFEYLLGDRSNSMFYIGFILGYLLYDIMHYAFHHAPITRPKIFSDSEEEPHGSSF
ncbi:MAG: sterol desaturase family protein [Saprospiraceae bacterium]